MQNVKHLRVLRALLVAFAILFAINISAPVAQAAPVDASQQTVVSTDNSLDTVSYTHLTLPTKRIV